MEADREDPTAQAIRAMKNLKTKRTRRMVMRIKRNHSQAELPEKRKAKKRNRIKNTKTNFSAKTRNSRNIQRTTSCYLLSSPL